MICITMVSIDASIVISIYIYVNKYVIHLWSANWSADFQKKKCSKGEGPHFSSVKNLLHEPKNIGWWFHAHGLWLAPIYWGHCNRINPDNHHLNGLFETVRSLPQHKSDAVGFAPIHGYMVLIHTISHTHLKPKTHHKASEGKQHKTPQRLVTK